MRKKSSGRGVSVSAPMAIGILFVYFGITSVTFSQTNMPAGAEDAPEEEVKEVLRNPFWPVEHKPKAEEQLDEEQKEKNESADLLSNKGGVDWEQAMNQVEINGVSSRAGSEFFAVINGEVKSVGDTVEVQVGSLLYSWTVDRIKPPGSVKLRRLNVK